MRESVLPILGCPTCSASLTLANDPPPTNGGPVDEIRKGAVRCQGVVEHRFPIDDGILLFGSGLAHPVVSSEINYEDSTYHGNGKLTDPAFIAGMPQSAIEVWPHVRHFGPDFEGLLDHLSFAPESWTLDVGTAACWTSRLLAQRGTNVVALDVNAAPFYGLRASDIQFEAHNVYFERVLSSMSMLPFGTGVFDHVVFNASLHHTPDLDRTLEEVHRVLKPRGIAAMVSESFVSLRHKFFPNEDNDDWGSHHDIAHSKLVRRANRFGFDVRHFLARHIRERLTAKLQGPIGDVALGLLERVPFLLQQLNSGLIILKKRA